VQKCFEGHIMYNWRKMTEEQKKYVLRIRQEQHFPLHSLPHFISETGYYHISSACYEHKSIIGKNIERITLFEAKLLKTLKVAKTQPEAYAVLPNHYHILIKTDAIKTFVSSLFKLHQTTGFYWNKEDAAKGRRIWCNLLDSVIKSDRHYWATINYINNNPVKHGYVNKWQEWPFSSAKNYIKSLGIDKVKDIWEEYDISEMCNWDK
jgi:putative transposase